MCKSGVDHCTDAAKQCIVTTREKSAVQTAPPSFHGGAPEGGKPARLRVAKQDWVRVRGFQFLLAENARPVGTAKRA